MEQARTTNERGKGELWRVVTDHPDIFDTHVVSKLNCNEVKFFYDVNRESRAAIKRSGVRLADAFKIGDFDTTSTLSWALEKCSENTKVRFCARMARNGRLDMLRFLCDEGCPWDRRTCFEAAYYGHLECLKYAHENGCPWDEYTCLGAAEEGHLECLKYAHEKGCPWDLINEDSDDDTDEGICSNAAKNGHLECLKYAHENGCPWNERICSKAAETGHLECLRYAHENGCPGSAKYVHHLLPARTRE